MFLYQQQSILQHIVSHSVSIADVYSVDGINLSDSIEDDDNNAI